MTHPAAHAQARYVPAGWLAAGGDAAALNALPAQRWWVRPFWIGRDPVTVAEYAQFLSALSLAEATAHLPSGLAPWVSDAEPWLTPAPNGWQPAPHAARLPIVGVSWWSAVAYCQWLSERDGLPWRLPTELEWERAARGDDSRPFPWGDAFAPDRCRMIDHLARLPPGPSPIDAFPDDLSPFGVRGMGGNTADWCLDAYRYEGPALASLTASDALPTAPRLTLDQARAQPPDAARVYRGGAWQYSADLCRAARRGINAPTYQAAHLGLRVACDG